MPHLAYACGHPMPSMWGISPKAIFVTHFVLVLWPLPLTYWPIMSTYFVLVLWPFLTHKVDLFRPRIVTSTSDLLTHKVECFVSLTCRPCAPICTKIIFKYCVHTFGNTKMDRRMDGHTQYIQWPIWPARDIKRQGVSCSNECQTLITLGTWG